MLEILRDGRMYKKNTLAEMLDTNPRNIIEYRKDLFESGYLIEYKKGSNGGYYLDSKCLIPTTSFTNNEKTALLRSYDFLKQTDFLHLYDYNCALVKIKSNFESNKIIKESLLNELQPKDFEIINNQYELLNDAILNKYKVSFKYITEPKLNSSKDFIVHPYELTNHHNFWYLICRVENDNNKFRIFKLSSRISKIKMLYGENFTIDEQFHDMNSSLVKSETIDIEFDVFNNTALILNERVVGIDSLYNWKNNTTLNIKTTIEGKHNAISLILSLGSDVKLLKPENLVEEIKLKIIQMNNLY